MEPEEKKEETVEENYDDIVMQKVSMESLQVDKLDME